MKRCNIAEVRRCCNGSHFMRGRAPRRKKSMKSVKIKNSPASYVWGVKNPQKIANKYNGHGVNKKK